MNGSDSIPHQPYFQRFGRSAIEQTIQARFAQQVAAHPDRLAVRSAGGVCLSYRQLDERSNQIAHLILAARGTASEPIAFLLDQDAASVEAILGILKAGKFYAPLDPASPVAALRRVVDDCGPGLILTDGKHHDAASQAGLGERRCLRLEAMDPALPRHGPGLPAGPDSLAYIFYTSGSTGPAKGVCDSHRNVLHNVMRYTNSLQIGPGDRLSLIQSCAFSGTVSTLFAALLNGASVHPFDLRALGVARLADWVAEEELTIFHSVPAIFEQLLGTRRDFPRIRLVRLEGDRAYSRHVSVFRTRLPPDCILVNGLGTTETGIIRQYFVTGRTEIASGLLPVGHAVEDMEVLLIRENGTAVPDGEVGEIAVRSRYLATGYWNNSELTDRAFGRDAGSAGCRVYRTGDMGRTLPGGCIQYLHRKDFGEKIRGQRIDIGEVEEALCALPAIRQAVATVREDLPGRQQLVAYVVPSGARPTVSALRETLLRSLPRHMLPGRYVFLDSLPADTNGKIVRRGLPPPDAERPPVASGFIAARGTRRKLIAGCFERVLGVRPVGVHDDFFELGGDSLLATELILSIEDSLHISCPPEFPYEAGTVAALDALLGSSRAHSILTLQGQGSARPLFVVHGCHRYRRLASLLAPDQPVIAIRRTSLRDPLHADDSIEELAAGYAREIRRLQADGPYQLCGNCFDGVIAFETARQLRGANQEVAFLGLIDSAFPSGSSAGVDGDASRNALLTAGRERLRRARVVLHRALLALVPGAVVLRDFLGRQCRRDLARFRPRELDGGAVLFCIGEVHNQRGWETVARGGLETVVLARSSDDGGIEFPHLVSPPYVEALAAELRKWLRA